MSEKDPLGHARERESLLNALRGAREVGIMLVEAKDIIGRDPEAWDAWRTANLEFSIAIADQYERIARNWDRIECAVNDGRIESINGAIAFLRDGN